jgi:hypothetical protein
MKDNLPSRTRICLHDRSVGCRELDRGLDGVRARLDTGEHEGRLEAGVHVREGWRVDWFQPSSTMTMLFHIISRSQKALLLGLEFLVAADIIRTVALEETLESVIVLGLLVLIRTFLSWALVVEIEGRWPWRQA